MRWCGAVRADMAAFYPVILAGGSGERFWPLSRRAKPKQFLALDDSGVSLLQATAARLAAVSGSHDRLFVVTGNDYRSQVLDQLPELPVENLIVEPEARDTAPAILYAALVLDALDPDAVMGVFPSDHMVGNTEAFAAVLAQAILLADQEDLLVTLGIQPTFASTGYGYIERGDNVDEPGLPAYHVTRFTEKPDETTAAGFLASGQYSWNSGMFVWRVRAILAAFSKYAPDLYEVLRGAVGRRSAVREVFPALRKISIDYAILEQADNVAVIPAEFGWDDLGDWNALERLLKAQGANVAVGRHVGLDTDGAILYTASGDDLIVTIGLDDVVVVRTDQVTLVVRKDRTQDIKKIVAELKARPELERFV